ncbi:carbohydrate binding domain-containing protein [Enhygromyxa salina]|nr:carbohydrate binding domain-containing protein [Enhygromyxa salina]
MRTQTIVAMCAVLTIVTACVGGSESEDSSFITLTGFGEGDGDSSAETDEGDGDGDGDPTTTGDGDGDGDPTTTGDGDGDPTTTGDGDGDIPIADMIDNFEDGDGALIPNNGRQGYWYSFNDESDGSTQTPAADMVLPESGGAGGTSMAMHTTGSGFAVWGAGIGVDLNNMGDPEGGDGIKMIYDASGYTGIVVTAKGNGQVRGVVQIEATIPPGEGGTCALDCDPHGKILVLSSEWQQFTLPFDQLAQEGWGTPAAWDATTVVGLQFKVAANANFDFWVDEIGFF